MPASSELDADFQVVSVQRGGGEVRVGDGEEFECVKSVWCPHGH